MTATFHGICISKGVAIGSAHVVVREQLEIAEYTIPDHMVKNEIRRFNNALKRAKQQLKDIRKQIPEESSGEITGFIDSHLLMLEDKAISQKPIQYIEEQKCNAEWALKIQRDALIETFNKIDSEYLRTRKDDIEHVIKSIQRILSAQPQDNELPRTSEKEKYIFVADDITPADTVLLNNLGVIGFVTEHGGQLSHTAILARNYGIPAITGIHNAASLLRHHETIIIDGNKGILIADPDKKTLRHYRNIRSEQKRQQSELKSFVKRPSRTFDGQKIHLRANIETPDDIKLARKVAAEGVGLYRTEFLYMNRDEPPSEEEQFKAYSRVVRAAKGLPVTIRTLDLGADKQVDGTQAEGRQFTNPALGLRAIRLCIREPEMFQTQLRAILRASAHGPINIMIPMLSNLSEIHMIQDHLNEVKSSLKQRRIKFDSNVPVGGMIEVPASAIMARSFARHLDFLSIGTNDLIQYTLAIDRVDDEVSYLYDPLHPAVLQLIQLTLEAGLAQNIPVSMCGEMAGDPQYTRLLLGMGLIDFSMHPSSLLEVKRIITTTSIKKIERPIRALMNSSLPDEIQLHLNEINQV